MKKNILAVSLAGLILFGLMFGLPTAVARAEESDPTAGTIDPLGTTKIKIVIEEGGDIESPAGTIANQNGAMYWNGSAWVTAADAGHMYFVNTDTNERQTPLRDVSVSTGETYTYDGINASVSIAVSPGEYSYTTEAAAGGSYTYAAREYRIAATYTDKTTNTTGTDSIVLRSKGVGLGTGSAYFDVFVQAAGDGSVAGVQSDPLWITYAGMSMDQAIAAGSGAGAVNGSLKDANADYFMDVSGGADMGGRSYILHTGSFPGAKTSDASNIYTTGFTLRYHGGSDVVNLNFLPLLLSETVPATAAGGGENFLQRTITNRPAGVTVSGMISGGDAPGVSALALHPAGTCAACDAIRSHMADDGQTLLWSGDVSLSSSYRPPLVLTIQAGSRYNGRTVTLLHCAGGGALETKAAVVSNGKAVFTVTGLSPMAVFTASDDELDNVPKTGGGNITDWLLIPAAAGAGMLMAGLAYRGRKKA